MIYYVIGTKIGADVVQVDLVLDNHEPDLESLAALNATILHTLISFNVKRVYIRRSHVDTNLIVSILF